MKPKTALQMAVDALSAEKRKVAPEAHVYAITYDPALEAERIRYERITDAIETIKLIIERGTL